MPRHSNGRTPLRVALWPIVTLVLVVVVIIATVAWTTVRNSARAEHRTQPTCPEGRITLPVYSDSRSNVVEQILRAYSATDPISGDYCVTASRVGSIKNAAVVISSDPAATLTRTIEAADRSPAAKPTRWPVVFWESVVLSAPRPQNFPSWPDAASVAVVNPQEPGMIQALAATALADGDVARALEITTRKAKDDSPTAVGETSVPPQATAEIFNDIRGPFRAVRLSAAGDVSEVQARAANSFDDFLRNNIDQKPDENTAPLLPIAEEVFERLAAQPQADAAPASTAAAEGSASASPSAANTTDTSTSDDSASANSGSVNASTTDEDASSRQKPSPAQG